MPVLEAQSCGTPVLTSNCSSLPEVGGNGAVYADPYSVEDITDGILKILLDPALARRLAEQGFENIKRFSWRVSAEKLDSIVERAAGENLT